MSTRIATSGPTARVVDFPALLALVAQAAGEMRVRFTTSHPKDMSDETLHVIAAWPNLCHHIHLPVQSGSNRILKLMNRKYTREWYLDRIAAIRRILPDCGITTDMFSGFHSETEEDFEETLSLIARGRIRLVVPLQILRASRYVCLEASARRCTRGGEDCPPATHDRLAERALAREQPPRHRPRVRSAGRGFLEAFARTALRPHLAKQRWVVFDKGNHRYRPVGTGTGDRRLVGYLAGRSVGLNTRVSYGKSG